MKVPQNSLECIEQLICFSSTDWSESQPKAWIYGVVVGWDVESIKGLVERYNWSAQQVAIMGELHRDFVKRRQVSPSLAMCSGSAA